MRFRCLVMDHDDTTVNSTATIHFPSFLAYLKLDAYGVNADGIIAKVKQALAMKK